MDKISSVQAQPRGVTEPRIESCDAGSNCNCLGWDLAPAILSINSRGGAYLFWPEREASNKELETKFGSNDSIYSCTVSLLNLPAVKLGRADSFTTVF